MAMNKITIEVEIDDQIIEDILVTAFEGGINYWCCRVTGHKEGIASDWFTKGGGSSLRILVDSDPDRHDLTLDNLLDAISQAVKQGVCSGCFDDDWYVDAGQADWIIQMAVFGEIIYG